MDSKNSGGPYCICRSYDDKRFMICCDRCNQWFHGDCMNINADESKKIGRFYCSPCQKTNPALETIFRSSPPSPASVVGSPKPSNGISASASAPSVLSRNANGFESNGCENCVHSPDLSEKSAEPAVKRQKFDLHEGNCGNCIGCFRKEDCGRCDGCRKENVYQRFCLLRKCVNVQSPVASKPSSHKDFVVSDSDQDEPHVDRRKRGSGSSRATAKLKNVGPRKETSGRVGRPPKHRPPAGSPTLNSSGTRASARAYRNFLKDAGVLPRSDDESDSKSPRQCHGPGCVYAARAQSKYCSDECGVKLAQLRIQMLLPSRLRLWCTRRPVAEEYEQRRQEKIHADLEFGRSRLVDLDRQEQELDAWRDKCKTTRTKENDGGKSGKSKAAAAESDDPETNVYCVTCGNETSMKNAIKHFAKCFSKYESQTSYGSSFKALNNLYNIFCDTYNKTNRTYCKRLRIICPEHAKDEKVDAHEICGFPLRPNKNLSSTTFESSSVCMALKKNCAKHYRWMQIRRALVDMERLTQLLRLEELSEESRCIQIAQNSRGSLVALLLHSTVSHESVAAKAEPDEDNDQKPMAQSPEDATPLDFTMDKNEQKPDVGDAGQWTNGMDKNLDKFETLRDQTLEDAKANFIRDNDDGDDKI